jgi:hypothetical protein
MILQSGSEASLVQILAGSLLGLFGGVGATALWEGLVRPRRDARNIARSLSAEIRLNHERLVRAVKTREESPRSIPFNVHLSTLVFESAVEKLAELPEEVLPDLVRVYHRFTSINAIRNHLIGFWDQAQSTEGSAAAVLAQRIEQGLEGLDFNVQGALVECDELLPKLVRYGRFTSEPWLLLASQTERPNRDGFE